MVTYFLLQEHSDDRYRLTSLVCSIKQADPDHSILIACTPGTKEFIENFKYVEANIRFHEIENTLGIAVYAKNWLTIIKEEIESGNELLFCHQQLTFVSKVSITDSVKSQGIGFIKKAIKVPEQQKRSLYSFDLLYISSLAAIEKMEKHYRDSTTLFVDGKVEWSKSEKDEFIQAWADMPLRFADYDDCVVCVSEYLDGKGYLGTENFFAFEDAWKMKDICYDNCLKHKEDDIYVVNIRFDTLERAVQELNKRLLNMVVQFVPSLMAPFNLKFSKDGKQDIGYPNEEGVAHWDRTQNKSFYRLLDELIETGLFKKVNVIADYFICNNRVLLDKVGEKWVTNALKKCFHVLTFDSDEKFSEIVSENDISTTFCGYIPFDRKKLEAFDPVELTERTFDESSPADLDWFIDHEENLEDYDELLTNLSQHSHAMITKMTPVSRLAECAYLGVVPVFDEGLVVKGLPELTGVCNDDVISMKSYYHDELSVSAIADKIMYNIFS